MVIVIAPFHQEVNLGQPALVAHPTVGVHHCNVFHVHFLNVVLCQVHFVHSPCLVPPSVPWPSSGEAYGAHSQNVERGPRCSLGRPGAMETVPSFHFLEVPHKKSFGHQTNGHMSIMSKRLNHVLNFLNAIVTVRS